MVFRDALASRDLEPPPDCGGFVARYTVDMSLQTLRLTSAALVLLAALAVPAFAQAPTPTPPGVPSPNATPEGKWVQPPADVPKAKPVEPPDPDEDLQPIEIPRARAVEE